MRRNKLALYLHLVWGTWDRQAFISADIKRRLLRNIEDTALEAGCVVIALNCMPDHVHLLVKIPTTITISSLVQKLKGVSSHFANEHLISEDKFKWQGYYGAFTVSRWDLDKIANYIKNQAEHHQSGVLNPDWEDTFETVDETGRNSG